MAMTSFRIDDFEFFVDGESARALEADITERLHDGGGWISVQTADGSETRVLITNTTIARYGIAPDRTVRVMH